ncbi:hypothetical protein [Caulobacter sp.]|uniref:hypothetical protein n=1 Tax=Caulobacter sp. TaxID=78 RepID=UPI0031DF3597
MAVALAGDTAASASPYRVGDCLWDALSTAQQQEVLVAYGKGMGAATSTLAQHDATVQAAAPRCVGAEGAPALLLKGAAASAMIRSVSSRSLQSERGLDASALERTWTASSETARTCTRVFAAKVFGPMADKVLSGQTCAYPKAPLELLNALKLDPKAPGDQSAVRHALIHFNGRAQGELMEAMLAAFLGYGAPKS